MILLYFRPSRRARSVSESGRLQVSADGANEWPWAWAVLIKRLESAECSDLGNGKVPIPPPPHAPSHPLSHASCHEFHQFGVHGWSLQETCRLSCAVHVARCLCSFRSKTSQECQFSETASGLEDFSHCASIRCIRRTCSPTFAGSPRQREANSPRVFQNYRTTE